ncbi:MAG: Na+/H+ antiporter subunit E [bacterium]|nr:Na+/H+ antiporter subunit E [bacterium]
MKSRILLFLAAMAVWTMLTWPPRGATLAAGALAALLASLSAGDFFVRRPHVLAQPRRYVSFLVYFPLFLWECLKANVDVAWRVSHPGMPISPGIVKVRTRLRSETGLTFLANSITLTPGTLSVDIDRKHGILYVHWIAVAERDIEGATRRIVERFERILARVFE